MQTNENQSTNQMSNSSECGHGETRQNDWWNCKKWQKCHEWMNHGKMLLTVATVCAVIATICAVVASMQLSQIARIMRKLAYACGAVDRSVYWR